MLLLTLYTITVATVLTVYGIETLHIGSINPDSVVATVLTVYGIETNIVLINTRRCNSCNSTYRLRY